MSFTQLDPCIPMRVEGKGNGSAIAIIDYGQEHNLIWVVALDDSGEIWCSPNPKVRLLKNWTMGRQPQPDLKPDAKMDAAAFPMAAE